MGRPAQCQIEWAARSWLTTSQPLASAERFTMLLGHVTIDVGRPAGGSMIRWALGLLRAIETPSESRDGCEWQA